MPYYMFIQKVLFPVTPPKMTIKVNGNNKTINLINEGEVNLTKTPGLSDIQIDDLMLPAIQYYPFTNKLGFDIDFDKGQINKLWWNVYKPDYYLQKLEAWKKKKKPVKFKMIRYSPDWEKLWDTSMYVTIEDYEIVEDAADQGQDVIINLNLKQWRDFGSKKLKIKNKKGKKQKGRAAIRDTYKKYKIKKGDSIYSIAKKLLGSSKRWKEIFNLNKKTLNKVAKKHGKKSAKEGTTFWLYEGTVIKIPHKDPHMIA